MSCSTDTLEFSVTFHNRPLKLAVTSILMNFLLPQNDGKQYAFSLNSIKPLWSAPNHSCGRKLHGYLRHLYQEANEDWPVRCVASRLSFIHKQFALHVPYAAFCEELGLERDKTINIFSSHLFCSTYKTINIFSPHLFCSTCWNA